MGILQCRVTPEPGSIMYKVIFPALWYNLEANYIYNLHTYCTVMRLPCSKEGLFLLQAVLT